MDHQKMRNLHWLKSKHPFLACTKNKGVCMCKENYIGEAKRIVEIRLEEHSYIYMECFNDCIYKR